MKDFSIEHQTNRFFAILFVLRFWRRFSCDSNAVN